MKWTVAFKAFFKALKDPEKAGRFLNDEPRQVSAPADTAHLRLLASLQESARFIDFLKEDIGSFTDAQVGAVVRKIHADCAQSLEALVTIRPLRSEDEGSSIEILKGYDPSEIKVTGNVKGEPPFKGILVHRGWKAHKRSLPKRSEGASPDVVCPAEVEIR
jgi:hypothetical protein